MGRRERRERNPRFYSKLLPHREWSLLWTLFHLACLLLVSIHFYPPLVHRCCTTRA